MALPIIDPKLSFVTPLNKRLETRQLVLHHVGKEKCSVQDIHSLYLAETWSGIGYNFYIRKDGSIYKGRGWEYVGAHTLHCNSSSIGICFEGDYEKEQSMPTLQFKAGVSLIIEAISKYPSIEAVHKHSEVGATECPGKYFPFEIMVDEGTARGFLLDQRLTFNYIENP